MNNPYEDAKLLGEYLLFHYGTDGDIMPWDFGPTSGLQFPRRTVEELVDVSKLSKELMSPNYLKSPVHLISDAQLVDLHLS